MKNSLKLALFLAFFMLERRGALMLAETKKQVCGQARLQTSLMSVYCTL